VIPRAFQLSQADGAVPNIKELNQVAFFDIEKGHDLSERYSSIAGTFRHFDDSGQSITQSSWRV
jgi:hypothetical protein